VGLEQGLDAATQLLVLATGVAQVVLPRGRVGDVEGGVEDRFLPALTVGVHAQSRWFSSMLTQSLLQMRRARSRRYSREVRKASVMASGSGSPCMNGFTYHR
jgi:hypothetical protein